MKTVPNPRPRPQALGTPGDQLGGNSNLVPPDLQVDVNWPLLAPTCALISQLGVKFGLNLPSREFFHEFLTLRTLIFAIPYRVFLCFSIF